MSGLHEQRAVEKRVMTAKPQTHWLTAAPVIYLATEPQGGASSATTRFQNRHSRLAKAAQTLRDSDRLCVRPKKADLNNLRNGELAMTFKYKRLDKDDVALLLVDHQSGLLSLVRDFSPDDFKNNVLALADIAKFFNIPTILTTSFENGPNGPMVPELKERFPDAPYFPRPGQINAWDNEDFVNAVKATGKKQLLIAGVVTDVCVAFPTLSAIEEGYDVFVVTDASGTFNAVTRDAAWSRMQAAGAQLMNWFSVAGELHRDWRNDIEGFGGILANHLPHYSNLMQSYSSQQK